MNDIIKNIKLLEQMAREIYKLFIIPLYKQSKKEAMTSLKKIELCLKELSKTIMEVNLKTSIQYSKELDFKKMKLFHEEFSIMANKLSRIILMEQHKKEIDDDLIKLKEDIVTPELYFDIEKDVKNNINLFLDFLDSSKQIIERKYTNVFDKKKSVDEMLIILDQKDKKIIELNNKIKDYEWIEAKENVKKSKVSELENELINKIKIYEQNITLLKTHILNIEKNMETLFKQIREITKDVNNIEENANNKEIVSLKLIKEQKDEILSLRYILSKEHK